MSAEAYKEIHKQVERLSRMHPDSSDASMTQTYLDWDMNNEAMIMSSSGVYLIHIDV